MSVKWIRYIRPRALGRAGYKCEICGATFPLEVHHIDGNPRNNSAENLEVRCADCHRDAHREPPPLAA